jgi:hypothetical protein
MGGRRPRDEKRWRGELMGRDRRICLRRTARECTDTVIASGRSPGDLFSVDTPALGVCEVECSGQ